MPRSAVTPTRIIVGDMAHIPARDRIASLFDAFEEFGGDIRGHDPIKFPRYEQQKAAASSSSNEREAVVTGLGTIAGQAVIAAVFEFGFLGGSMGEAVGERLVAAMKKAAEAGRPFLTITSTGGARMQEGMAALAQMPRTVAASARLGEAGVPRISVFAHPTTGGVYASFASLSDILIAERGATVGFAGPRLAEAISGRRLPEGSHTAEAAFEAGLVDAVVDPIALPGLLSKLLRILESR